MAKKQVVSMVGSILTVEYPTIGKTFTVDTSTYDASIHADAQRHGFRQKFGDAASGQDPAAKFAEVQKIHASLLEGNWERVSIPDQTPTILEAVSRVKGHPVEAIRKAISKEFKKAKPEDTTEEEFVVMKAKEWASNAAVKAAIAQIRAEKAAAVAAESDDEIEINL
jgi:hypothetical protein